MTVRNITYSIVELAQEAQVSRRTVRYYVQRGLLPPPEGKGRGSHYTQKHLQQLLLIKQAQLSGMSLEDVEKEGIDTISARVWEEIPQERNTLLPQQNIDSLPQMTTWNHIPLFDGVVLQVRSGSLSEEQTEQLQQLLHSFLSHNQESSS